jgi:hypothetical protein
MRTSFSSVIASGATAILDERQIAKPLIDRSKLS